MNHVSLPIKELRSLSFTQLCLEVTKLISIFLICCSIFTKTCVYFYNIEARFALFIQGILEIATMSGIRAFLKVLRNSLDLSIPSVSYEDGVWSAYLFWL